MTMLTDCIPYQSTKEIAGVRPLFYLPPSSDMAWWEELGVPEADLITWAVQNFLPNRNAEFVDVGCHVGTWSIPIAMRGNHVTAFEAQPWIADLCRRGMEANDCKMDLYTTALGDHFHKAILRAPYADGGGGSIVCDFTDPSISMEVYVHRLDGYDTRPALMKVDCEGAELDVLRGGRRTIEKYAPKILFEVWADERGQRKEDLFRYIQDELGYRYQQIWPETWLAEPI
jgi:FkbM family methyltransferase